MSTGAAAAPKGIVEAAYRALELKQNPHLSGHSGDAEDLFVREALSHQAPQAVSETAFAAIGSSRKKPPLKLIANPSGYRSSLRNSLDTFATKLQLLLGLLSGSAVAKPLQFDLNLLSSDARDLALGLSYSSSGSSDPTTEEVLDRVRGPIEAWMRRRTGRHLRVFERMVVRPSAEQSSPVDHLGRLERYLVYQVDEAEKEIQLAKLLAQILEPLPPAGDLALNRVVEAYLNQGSPLSKAVNHSFTTLFDLGLRSPAVRTPMEQFSYPGVLEMRWGHVERPSFLRAYLRFRSLFEHSRWWYRRGSLVSNYVLDLPGYYEALSEKILARCKLETSTLVKSHRVAQKAPRHDPESDDPVPVPKVPEDMELDANPSSLPSQMDRTNAAALYANWARGVLEFEVNLAFIVLGRDKKRVRELLANVINSLVDKIYQVLEPDFHTLLDSGSWPDLAVLYDLASRMPKAPLRLNPDDELAPKGDTFVLLAPERPQFHPRTLFLSVFRTFVEDKSCAIVRDGKDEDMISHLLDLWNNLSEAVDKMFVDQSELFRAALRDGFEAGIAKRDNKPAEMLAKHLDVLLRTGNRSMTETQLEQALDDSLLLFRFIKDKDMFEEFYTRHFAKRLLLSKSASSDAEASMLLKLKSTCGSEFTQRLETMLKDITVSEDMMASWEIYANKADKGLGLDVAVSVLTQAHWPSYPVHADVRLPPELEHAAKLFEQFYSSRNQGRTLRWQHNLGMNVVMAQMPNKREPRELVVSTYQAMVLLLFNKVYPLGVTVKGKSKEAESEVPPRSLSYTAIAEQTNLPPEELKRVLQSLASGPIPTRILRKHPQGKDVALTDVFTVNENMKNERLRIRINQIQLKETGEEQKQTEQQVFLERELVIQAAAVRILKAKKTISNNSLLQDVIKAISSRFTVDVSEIKRAFEALIDKDYMERVEGQRNMYRYVA